MEYRKVNELTNVGSSKFNMEIDEINTGTCGFCYYYYATICAVDNNRNNNRNIGISKNYSLEYYFCF